MKGIYKITQKSTGKIYIGQSINIDNRWNQHAFSIDNLSFHEQYRHNPTDFTFEVLIQNDSYTKDDLDKLEKRYIADYHSNDSKYGFNATAGNGKLKEITKSRMLMVKGSIDRMMNKNFLRGVEDKKILVIGNFNISETSLYNDMTILTDDFDYTCETAKIIRVEGGDEIMAQLNNMKDEKFDLIIANPPYNMGNKIISNCVDKAKECVVLMPFSKYKANELYKHVLSLEIVDPKAFKDATITTNLCVCKLIPNKIERTFEELELETFDQKYREFYELNQKMPNKITYACANKFYDGSDENAYEKAKNDLEQWWKEHDKKFCVTWRAVLDGTHNVDNAKAFDIKWNVLKNVTEDDFPICQSPKRNNTAITIDFIDFNTSKECQNFTRFFYAGGKSGLMNVLVKGMKKVMGSINAAIPNIDWSIDRDYEHLTYEELLQIMKDELKRK